MASSEEFLFDFCCCHLIFPRINILAEIVTKQFPETLFFVMIYWSFCSQMQISCVIIAKLSASIFGGFVMSFLIIFLAAVVNAIAVKNFP